MGVHRDAGQNDIKRAFRGLAREHHPDVNPDDHSAEARFKELNEAYQVLSDKEKREVYDRYGHSGVDQSYGANFGGAGDFGGFGDIFDMFFGGSGRGAQSRPTAERGRDLRYDQEMTLEQAAHGLEVTIPITRMEKCDACSGSGAEPGSHPETCSTCRGSGQVRQQHQTILGAQIRITTCPKCHGEGVTVSTPCKKCGGQGKHRHTTKKTVQIPAGVDTGTRIRVPGEGDAGVRGGPPGDLYIITHIRKHDYFERRDNDLWCQIPISMPLAALGTTIEVRTIDGTEQLHVAAGTQPGEVYTLRGKGMPDPMEGLVGNLNVLIKVQTPTHLNDEQKTLLREFAELRGEEVTETRDKGLFERMKDVFSGL